MFSHANNRKEKKIEKKINIDLVVVTSQWFKVANYNTDICLLESLLHHYQVIFPLSHLSFLDLKNKY